MATYTFNTPSGPVAFRNIYSIQLTDDDAMSDDEDESKTEQPSELYECIDGIFFQHEQVQILTKEGNNYIITTDGIIREFSESEHNFVVIENSMIELSDDHKYMRLIEL